MLIKDFLRFLKVKISWPPKKRDQDTQLKKFLLFEIDVAIPTPTPKVSILDPP